MDNALNMQAIADAVRAAGYYAYVEHTGGGVQTIYAWRIGGEPKRDATGRPVLGEPDVMAGPGVWREHGPEMARADAYSGRTAVNASLLDYGDDDYQTDLAAFYGDAPFTGSEQDFAELIVGQLQTARAQFGPRTWATP